MGRALRLVKGDVIYHAINRANGRMTIFENEADYEAFERIIQEATEKHPMRILSYVIMPNHWHFILYPFANGDLSSFK